MAVSNRALAWLWALALATTGAAWLTGGARFKPPSPKPSDAERQVRSAVADSVRRLGLLVRTEEVRSTIDSAIQSYPPERAPSVLVLGGGSAATLASRMDSLVASFEFPARPNHPLRLALIEGPTGPRVPLGLLPAFTLLPAPNSAEACTAVYITLSDHTGLPDRREWRHRQPLGGALGPCWYLATFGEPGPGVRRWLDSRYWDVASAIPPDHEQSFRTTGAAESGDMLQRLLLPVLSPFLAQIPMRIGCAGDKPQLCEAAFLAPLPAGILPDGIAAGEELEWRMQSLARANARLSPTVPLNLLANMVDDLGPTRFAEFWGSGAPVAEAFQSVAGMSLGEWYRGQLRQQMREAGIPEPPRRPFWPSTLGFLALALGGSLWLAGRREVR